MTERLARSLQLPMQRCETTIGALDNAQIKAHFLVNATIESRVTSYSRSLTFLTVPNIGGLQPHEHIERSQLRIPPNLDLADPQFHRPAEVDMLISSGPTLSMLSIGQIKLTNSEKPDLILQKTQLGWTIGGSIVLGNPEAAPHAAFLATKPDFDIERFWKIEEINTNRHLSIEEQACEEHFIKTVKRDGNGKYIVALPFNGRQPQLGESRSLALKRFHGLERKFRREPQLKEQYEAVLKEYQDLGHMTELQEDNPTSIGFYLPHHAVTKETSLTTKTRVVFDGSAKSSSGISLNETLMVGATIQDHIVTLLLRFRMHRFVLTGDIEKMYRQFWLRKEDRKYQRLLWTNPQNELRTYELNTITFGLSAAPHLAIRCLQQLADDEAERFPVASEILKRDFYVDDLLTGADTYQEAAKIRDDLIGLLSCAGLNLRQWASNEPTLLNGLSEGSVHRKLHTDDATIKTLGVYWDSQTNTITYTVGAATKGHKVTKRAILSEIAKIYDPLGLLGPVVTRAKILMQELWRQKLDWDESVPVSIHTEWNTFRTELGLVDHWTFDRRVTTTDPQEIQLHGFCDASERAYGACFYLRSEGKDQSIHTALIGAKSRVAPLKTISLPRLELCGALLLADLYTIIKEAMHLNINRVVLWTDSTIALHWIHTSPHRLHTFVANRVSKIQQQTETNSWRHVRSEDNPADHISRGQLPSEFTQESNWKTGPPWLCKGESEWPKLDLIFPSDVPEQRKVNCLTLNAKRDEFLCRYSSVKKLRHVVAYCLRFSPNHRFRGPLAAEEIDAADNCIVRCIQAATFSEEIKMLNQGKEVGRNSSLWALNPFIDETGVIRVGSRLKNAEISYSQRYPKILPKGHHVTTLLVRHEHLRNLHAGVQSTLYALRQRYWLIDGRNQVRRIIRQCVRCTRAQPPLPVNYIMGNLPAARVTRTRPFSNVGIDYCGPFFIKERKYRNLKRIKTYVAVFVCLAVKAIHLEVVSDLTADGFLAAFKRFVARRGRPRHVYSDNGTNFVGANNQLRELFDMLQGESQSDQIQRNLAEQGITWHFNPPQAPHFGGLWEAGVKAFKRHMKRVVGDELFTFEQFNTFVTQVEEILNSRPLTPISTDPNDPIALTPGHYLIGDSLRTVPEADISLTPSSRLPPWKHIQKVKEHFWKRWHREYVNELTTRHKWISGTHHIKEGTVVIVRDDHSPPTQWTLGRVVKVYPGQDGIIRTVQLKTASGVYDRSVKKLAPLFDDSPVSTIN